MKNKLILALCFSVSFAFSSCIGCGSGDSGVSDSGEYDNYKEACKDGAFEDAHEKLEKIHESLEYYDIGHYTYLAKAREYFSALEYIYKAEIQYIVTSMDDEACKDKLTFLLAEIPIDGQKPDKSFNIISSEFEEDGDSEVENHRLYKVYGYYVTSYNHLLDHALTLAINRKYKKLAESILIQYIDDLEFELREGYYYTNYSRSSYNAAKEKYDQAVSMQLFE